MGDEDESMLRRPPPPAPYRLPPDTLHISPLVLERTLASLRRFRNIESACFWFGPRAGRDARVAAVVTPRQRGTWGNYIIAPDAMIEVATRLAGRGWENLAQVHSHPGLGVEHSRFDDAMASSLNAMSMVFPNYGAWRETWPQGVGVHEHQADYWHRLQDADAARRVRCDGSGDVQALDLR